MKRSLLLMSLTLLLVGCPTNGDPDQGIAIGNPGVVELAIGSASGLDVAEALIETQALKVVDCEGEATQIELQDDLLFLGEGVEVPSGTWCSLQATDAFVYVELWTGDDEDPMALLDLAVGTVTLNGATTEGFEIGEEQALLLEILGPEYTSIEELGLDLEPFVVVETGHPAYEALVGRVHDDAALYEDADGDGVVDDGERSDGPTASTAEPVEPEDPGNTIPGCSAVGGGGVGLLGLVLSAAVGVRRRRSSAPPAP